MLICFVCSSVSSRLIKRIPFVVIFSVLLHYTTGVSAVLETIAIRLIYDFAS